ncbi:unnamed protein product [Symbiodinium sp. CCMP2592]|nr:unnamed protein product [Symbiodinium sp. CCMP2592]
MAIDKKAKKVKKEKKVKDKTASKTKKEREASPKPAVRRLKAKTSPRTAKRKSALKPTSFPKAEEPAAKKAKPASAGNKQSTPEVTKDSKPPKPSAASKKPQAEGQTDSKSKAEAPTGPVGSKQTTPEVPKDTKESRKKAKHAQAKREKKERKEKKRKEKTKAAEQSSEEDQSKPGPTSEATASDAPATPKNLLPDFETQDWVMGCQINTEDTEINAEYLDNLLGELAVSDEEATEESGKSSEDEASSSAVVAASSDDDAEEDGSGPGDDESDASHSSGGSSSSSEDEEESEGEEEDCADEKDQHGADGEKEQVSAAPAAESLAVVAAGPVTTLPAGANLALVAANAGDATQAKANSTTNKKEWDTFTRECKNRKVFPVELSEYYEKNKTDLFNLVKVHVERVREKKITSRSGAQGMKQHEIAKIYDEVKTQKLCAKLKAEGRFYYDPEFPEDETEIYYYLNRPRKVNVDNIASERANMTASMQVEDSDVMAELTGPDGVFAAGAMPAVKVATVAGEKALVDSIAEAPTAKGTKKPKKQKGEGTADPVEPATARDHAEDLSKDLLKAIGDARKLSLALQGIDYSDKLGSELISFAETCEKSYVKVNKALLKKKDKKEGKTFDEFIAFAKEKLEWFQGAEAGVAAKCSTHIENPYSRE